jgi:hypothetical protein
MRVGNFCNGALLITCGIVVFLLPSGSLVPSFATITLSAYTVFLGCLTSCVELNFSLVQAKIRTNCGFLFTSAGRCIFLLFTATVALALGTSSGFLPYIIGGVTALNGLWNLVVLFTHPGFRAEGFRAALQHDPSAGASTAESHIHSYLSRHPDLVAKAVGATAASAGAARGATIVPNPASAAALSAALSVASSSSSAPAISASAYDTPVVSTTMSRQQRVANASSPPQSNAGSSSGSGAQAASSASSAISANPFSRAAFQRADSVANPFSSSNAAAVRLGPVAAAPDASSAAFASLASRAGGTRPSFISNVDISDGRMGVKEYGDDNPFA